MSVLGECWEWNGNRTLRGYGSKQIKNKMLRLHRIAWAWANWDGVGDWKDVLKTIPTGLFVLHRCDNPPCVNPAHLFLGTSADNIQDRDAKGRNYYRNLAHCRQGHPFSGKNLQISKQGWRRCAICNRKNTSRYYAAKRRESCAWQPTGVDA